MADVYGFGGGMLAQAKQRLAGMQKTTERRTDQAKFAAIAGISSGVASFASASLGGPEGKKFLGDKVSLPLGLALIGGGIVASGQAGAFEDDAFAFAVGSLCAYTSELGRGKGLQRYEAKQAESGQQGQNQQQGQQGQQAPPPAQLPPPAPGRVSGGMGRMSPAQVEVELKKLVG